MGDEIKNRLIWRIEYELRLWPFAENNEFLSKFGNTVSESPYNNECSPRNLENLTWRWNHEKLEEASESELWILMALCYAYRCESIERALTDASLTLDSLSSDYDYLSRSLLKVTRSNKEE